MHVHPKNIEIAELAAKTIGLDIAGIDMVIPDITKPMEKGYGAIVEVNAAPGIRMHLNPSNGIKHDVAIPILDMIYPKNMPFTIPIVSVTGTNGKTTITRMISSILKSNGYLVGTTTTHGIYVNDKCIEKGDTTGPKSARRILFNHEIDAAVLETARGGIIREGLAYEKADIAVFSNLTEDHLGIDGINTMEELLHVKTLVIEAVKQNGACILNADDPWIMKAKDKAGGEQVLFSLNENNAHILEHINSGKRAVYIKENSIYYTNRGLTKEIMKISDIPATMNGGLKHNIYNSLAAIAASICLKIPIRTVKTAISGFSCDENINPGRFNVYDMGEYKIVLDYGHNIDGYRVTIEGLKCLNPTRLIGIIGVPGDRRDEDLRNIGELSGASFDKILIKEDKDLRGRKTLEVAKILRESALKVKTDKNNIEIIANEEEALKNAIINAKSGDVIVVFFEKLDPLVELVKSYQSLYFDLEEESLFV